MQTYIVNIMRYLLILGLGVYIPQAVAIDKDLAKHLLVIDAQGRLDNRFLATAKAAKDNIALMKKAIDIDTNQDFQRILAGIKSYVSHQYPKEIQCQCQGKRKELVFYIHGGLNDPEDSLNRANQLYKKILTDCKYPIFINWNSAGLGSYMDHLFRIRQGEPSPSVLGTGLVYLLTDLVNTVTNTPKSYLVQGEHTYDSTRGRDRMQEQAQLKHFAENNTWMSFTGSISGFSNRSRQLQWFVTSPFKLVSTPIVYTLAPSAWDVMLYRTNTLFYTPEDFSNEMDYLRLENYSGEGALALFLNELSGFLLRENIGQRHWAIQGKNTAPYGGFDLDISLIGHSMGAIVVNRILAMELKGLAKPIKNIVNMASADSIRNMLQMTLPYLEKINEARGCKAENFYQPQCLRFYSLSLHPENEDREVSLGGITPSGSLLVWLDDMFTRPESLLDKRSGRWANIQRVAAIIPHEDKFFMRFKVFGLDNSKPSQWPQQHGDFDEFTDEVKFWDQEFWWK